MPADNGSRSNTHPPLARNRWAEQLAECEARAEGAAAEMATAREFAARLLAQRIEQWEENARLVAELAQERAERERLAVQLQREQAKTMQLLSAVNSYVVALKRKTGLELSDERGVDARLFGESAQTTARFEVASPLRQSLDSCP